MKSLIRKLLPEDLLLSYHRLQALLAAWWYCNPTKKMVVIGLSGTKGKTSTANFVWAALTGGGLKVGLIGTANIRIGEDEQMNPFHMTMPGSFVLQRFFSQMQKAGCTHCVVETTSEGIKQWRHSGIAFDFLIFTNLTPEHLPSHGGSFEKYKATKGKLFASLEHHKEKVLNGKRYKSTVLANADDEHAPYFLRFAAQKKITYALHNRADYVGERITSTNDGVDFYLGETHFRLKIAGAFNVYNALPAVAIAHELGIPYDQAQRGFDRLAVIPGRMEKIPNVLGFTVIVDYAHEKISMTAALESARAMLSSPEKNVIVLLGAEGGGRDKSKRPAMGKVAAELADDVICSNVDPYNDDPAPIAEDIAVAAEQGGKRRGENLFVILDRREGIRKALELAHPGDVVMITGKGAEQSIVIGGKSEPWDDRVVVREELKRLAKERAG